MKSALLTLTLVAAAPAAASAADFDVTSTVDAHDLAPGDGLCRALIGRATFACTLRAAIEEANATVATDVVTVPAGTYNLPRGELLVSRAMSLNGATAATTILNAGDDSRVLRVQGQPGGITVNLRRVTLTDGDTFDGGSGAVVHADARLNLIDSVVADNVTIQGGAGIWNEGYVRLLRTSVRNNVNVAGSNGGGVTATGGGVLNGFGATLIVERSAIVNNFNTRAGGIANRGGTVRISDSTLSGNEAVTYGGAIANFTTQSGGSTRRGSLEIIRSTITDNVVGLSYDDGFRGGAGIANLGDMTLVGSILAGNVEAVVHNDPSYSPDCLKFNDGAAVSQGYNVIGTSAGCALGFAASDAHGTPQNPLNPGLAPLAPWKAGGTELHTLLANSPARGNGPRCISLPPGHILPDCTTADQRGYGRAGGDSADSDSGAWEHDGTQPSRYVAAPNWPIVSAD